MTQNPAMNRLRIALLLIAMVSLRANSSLAGPQVTGVGNPLIQQPANSFEELKLHVKVGETVYVVDISGQETRGRIATLSQVALTLTVDGTRRDFVADAIRRIDRRRRDSVWNGVLIGAGAGALMGFAVGRTADSPDCPRSGIECGQGAVIGTVGGALWGAVGGWITDVLMRKRETVYSFRGPPE